MYSPYYNSERVPDLQGFYKPNSTFGKYDYMGGANPNQFPYTSTTPVFNKFSPTGLTENPGMSFNQNKRQVPVNQPTVQAENMVDQDKATGPNIGNITNAAVAGGDVITDAINMGKEADAIQTQAPQIQYDSDGKPMYGLGQQYLNVRGIRPQGVTPAEYHAMTAKGMSAGAQVGGPWGALIGAVVGSGAALIGGGRRKKKMQEAKRKAKASLLRRQQEYSESTQEYDQARLAREAYEDRMNKQNRLYNIYNRT